MATLKVRTICVYILCWFSSGMAIAEDLSLGESLFRQAGGYGCMACHGQFAEGGGQIGGNIRAKNLLDINRALTDQPTMQGLASVLSDRDRRQLAKYLAELNTFKLITWNVGIGKQIKSVRATSGELYQLVVSNKGFEVLTLQLSGVNEPRQVTIAPYQTLAFTWQAVDSYLLLASDQSRLQINLEK